MKPRFTLRCYLCSGSKSLGQYLKALIQFSPAWQTGTYGSPNKCPTLINFSRSQYIRGYEAVAMKSLSDLVLFSIQYRVQHRSIYCDYGVDGPSRSFVFVGYGSKTTWTRSSVRPVAGIRIVSLNAQITETRKWEYDRIILKTWLRPIIYIRYLSCTLDCLLSK
jgi:hypothetical protein